MRALKLALIVLPLVLIFTAFRLSAQVVSRAQPSNSGSRSWTLARLPDGQPDFQGVWINNSATPLERPKELEGRAVLTAEEVEALEQRATRIFDGGRSDIALGDNTFFAALRNVDTFRNPNATANSLDMIPMRFDQRTSLVTDPADGRIPALTPEGARRRASAVEANQRLPTGIEDLSDALRCISFGVPRLGGAFGAGPYGYYQIVQGPGYVVLIMESIHDARLIALDGHPHVRDRIRLRNGDSRGRWEGDTLVVDTTNFSPAIKRSGSFSAPSAIDASENLHLVERLTRVSPDTLEYEMTFIDPATWTRPWTAMIPLHASQDQIYEFACHEGNTALTGILRGARADPAR